MSTLDDLAAFVCSASAADLPASDRAILRRHISDGVAARLAGAACSEGKAILAIYPAGQGPDSIAGLAALVRLTETDDIHIASCTTPSSVAVPVALGLAAAEPCGAERLESAVHVGLELVVRLGKSIDGARALYKGVWPTRAGATLGAAAAACRVWGLSSTETKHALSMAVMLTSGRTGRFHGQPSGRWVLFASAVSAGIRAAIAARHGCTGDFSVLDGDWLARSLGVPVDANELVRDLGRKSVLSELSLKPYCTSRQALSGAEAMRALIAKGLDPSSIESFTIRVPAAYAGMIGQKLDPAVRSTSYVSGAGLAAIAALDPASLHDVERAKAVGNANVVALAAKGEVVVDPTLDEFYPSRWPARIEVRTRSGTLNHEIIEPLGDPGNPIGERQWQEKARMVLTQVGRSDALPSLLATTESAFGNDASAAALARYFVSGGA